jgi:hypothetical protein
MEENFTKKDLEKIHPGSGSRIQGVKKLRIPDPDPQHCERTTGTGTYCTLFYTAIFCRLSAGMEAVKQLLALAAFGSRSRLYSCRMERPELVAAFLDAHAQTLGALKAWCHWLAALHSESLRYGHRYLKTRLSLQVVYLCRHVSSTQRCHL